MSENDLDSLAKFRNPAALGPPVLREAKIDDAEPLLNLIRERQDDIPHSFEGGLRRINEFYDTLNEYCRSHRSLVAINHDRELAGCLLLRPSRRLWSRSGFDLDFLIVRKRYEGKGLMSQMVRRAQTFGVPLLANVKRSNRFNMRARFVDHLGFTSGVGSGEFSEEQHYLWTPPDSAPITVPKDGG